MKSAASICKAARKAAGLSQEQLARLAHCTRRTVQNIEAGLHQPSYLLLRTIENVCEREAEKRKVA